MSLTAWGCMLSRSLDILVVMPLMHIEEQVKAIQIVFHNCLHHCKDVLITYVAFSLSHWDIPLNTFYYHYKYLKHKTLPGKAQFLFMEEEI